MENKMITYVLTLSKVFPVGHPAAGAPTNFEHKIQAAINGWHDHWPKLHTIRANYELWQKRFEKIERGEACLSLRQWTGKPYFSKQIEIARLTKGDGIGLQRLDFEYGRGILHPGVIYQQAIIRNMVVPKGNLAYNDGLLYNDWIAWFDKYELSKTFAVIQFTKFRY